MSTKPKYTKIKPKVGYSFHDSHSNSKKENIRIGFYLPQNKEEYKSQPSKRPLSQIDNKGNNSICLNDSKIKVMPRRRLHKNEVSNDYDKVSLSLNQTLRSNNEELSKLLSTSHHTHMPFIQKTSMKIKQQMLYDYKHLSQKKTKYSSVGKIPVVVDLKKTPIRKHFSLNKTPIKIKKRTHSVTDKDTTRSSGSILRDHNKKNNRASNVLNKSALIEKRKPLIKTVKSLTKKIRGIHDKSKTGMNGDEKKYNQDSSFIYSNFNGHKDYYFLGVCDGHGLAGHEISGFIKENLPGDIDKLLKSKNLDVGHHNVHKIIEEAFVQENHKLLRQMNIDSHLSGTTCVSVIYTPEKLITANIGDSRAVLGKCVNNTWIHHDLSNDHKPSDKKEAERILKTGRIRPMKDENGEFIGPLRVYMKEEDTPGLAMTRSFGDYFASLAGTIPIPEIIEYKFQIEDKFMVLASDGLFEYIDSKEVVMLIKNFYLKNDIVGCCDYLYEESKKRWLSQEFDAIDDITMIVVFFD